MRALLIMAMLTLSASAHGQTLVTQVTGPVTYTVPAAPAKKPVQAFMKARTGDAFELPAKASLRLVYYRTGRQEIWTGPASFRVGKGESVAIGSARPAVSQLPKAGAKGLRRVPSLLKRAGITRMGASRVRSGGDDIVWQALKELTPQARVEYEAALVLYAEMDKQRRPGDPTPELALIGVLGKLKLRAELVVRVAAARKRFPKNDTFAMLDAWLHPPKAPPAK